MGSVALGHVGSSWPRDGTRVPCIGRQSPILVPSGKSREMMFDQPLPFPFLSFQILSFVLSVLMVVNHGLSHTISEPHTG